MYKIYVDGVLIHSTKNNDLKVDNPEIEEELNEVGKLEFSIYPKNKRFVSFTSNVPQGTPQFQKMKSIVEVYKNNKLDFRGRLLNNEDGFYIEKKITCESDLGFLIDSKLRPYVKRGTPTDLFNYYLSIHNAQMGDNPEKQFLIGKVSELINEDNIIKHSSDEIVSVWEEIKNKLIDTLGGYLIVDNVIILDDQGNQTLKRRINWLSEDDFEFQTQTIDFTENLLDIKINVEGNEIATAIIPVGAKLEATKKDEETGDEIAQRLTIEEIEDGTEYEQDDGDVIVKKGDYIFSKKAVALYGFIEDEAAFDDVETDVNQLLKNGIEVLNERKASINSIEIQAFDTSIIKNVSSFKLGTKIKAYSKLHGFNGEIFPITKMKRNLVNPASNVLTLTKVQSSFVERSVQAYKGASKINKSVSQINEIVETSNKNVDSVKQDVNNVKNDYTPKKYTDDKVKGLQDQIDAITGKTSIILWDGQSSLSNEASLELSDAISSQFSGIVLLFSTNDGLEYFPFFLPKSCISLDYEAKKTFYLASSDFSKIGTKTLILSDTSITGHENNTLEGTSNGITYNNASFELRYVIGT